MFEDDAKNTADALLKEISKFFDNMVEHIENQIRRSAEFKAEKLGHKYLPGEALTSAKQFQSNIKDLRQNFDESW